MGRFSDDERLNPTHVSLYLALFLFWNMNRFRNPISISRSEVMRVSKIGSNATYHRCITDLHKWKYLEYIPSKNPFKGSMVNMFIFEPSDKQASNINSSNSEQVPEQVVEQALVPYINSIKHKKLYKHNKQEREEEKKSSPHPSQNKNDESSFRKDELHSSKKASRGELNSPNKNEMKSPSSKKKFSPPELQEVKTFFHENKSSYQVAEMFFNHFESNGWKVAGKAPMKKWKAAARNWIMRDEKYQAQSRSPAQQRLHVNENKDYSEPL